MASTVKYLTTSAFEPFAGERINVSIPGVSDLLCTACHKPAVIEVTMRQSNLGSSTFRLCPTCAATLKKEL